MDVTLGHLYPMSEMNHDAACPQAHPDSNPPPTLMAVPDVGTSHSSMPVSAPSYTRLIEAERRFADQPIVPSQRSEDDPNAWRDRITEPDLIAPTRPSGIEHLENLGDAFSDSHVTAAGGHSIVNFEQPAIAPPAVEAAKRTGYARRALGALSSWFAVK